jgi:ATP-dependent Clp protease ATP-binding subunit ClpA
MLSKELEFSINLAFREARDRRHEFMTVEHLLLALLDNPAAAEVLAGLRRPSGQAETRFADFHPR